MTFIITLMSLVIERFFHWNHLRYWGWFNKYQQWLSRRVGRQPSYALVVLSVLPFVVLVGAVNAFLGHWWYGILELIFGVLILLYCLGPENLWVQAYGCLHDLHKENPQDAVEHAQAAFGISAPTNSQLFHRALTHAIFTHAYQRVFAVVFWFVILGPMGAVLYRLLLLCAKPSDSGLTKAAGQLISWLDWIPVRIFTFFFALGGHFMLVFRIWKKDVAKGVSENEQLITDCGIAALDVTDDHQLPEDGAAEKATLELLDRVFVMFLVVLAVIVLMIK